MKPLIAILLAAAYPLCAADPIDIAPYRLCREANFHELRVTTITGESLVGLCLSVDVNDIAVRVKGRPVRVSRDKVARVVVLSGQHQLRSLGENIRDGLHWGVRTLLSPGAVVGVVEIPAILAWGMVAAPFCIVGDLVAKGTPDREIRLR